MKKEESFNKCIDKNNINYKDNLIYKKNYNAINKLLFHIFNIYYLS